MVLDDLGRTMGAVPVALTWDQVLSWRMDRQFLDRRESVDAADVVRRLAGVQAQVASCAEQAAAARRPWAEGNTAGALADRTIVKTWAQRGTLHLLAAEDAAEDAAAFLSLLGSGWGALLKPLAWQGLLCHGIGLGNRVTFTSPATWLPGWNGLPEPGDAAAAVIPAYLGAHGPASSTSFDQWLFRGATKKAVLRSWFAALVEDGVLTEVQVEGEPLYARSADLDALSAAVPTERVRLLPAFDQYVLGPGTTDQHLLAPARRSRISKAAGWISPVVVAGGRVAGTWQADGGTLIVELFGESEPVDRSALDAEIAVLERVLDRRLTPSVVTV